MNRDAPRRIGLLVSLSRHGTPLPHSSAKFRLLSAAARAAAGLPGGWAHEPCHLITSAALAAASQHQVAEPRHGR